MVKIFGCLGSKELGNQHAEHAVRSCVAVGHIAINDVLEDHQ